MTITALIPTKNRAALLRRAINSVQSQKYKNVKICVRDNGSTDNTQEMVRGLQSVDCRVNYMMLNKDIGAHENFRQGMQNIDTEYFSILSDDDYLHEDFYNNGIDLLEKNPTADFVVFSVDIVDIEQNFISNNEISGNSKIATYYTSHEGIVHYLENRIPITWTGYIFRKRVSEEIDLGDFSEVGYGADIRFIWHAACRFDFVVSGLKGAFFTAHSNTTSGQFVKAFDERFIFWWRNRIHLILRDYKINAVAREILEEFYFKNTKKRYGDKSYYLMAAFGLVSKRLAANEEKELRFDFIAMRSFLPAYMIFFVKYFYSPLVKTGLAVKLRDLTVFCRDSVRRVLS